ncbi:prolyl oligopeptidase family serine peptidase [Sphingomonas sp. LY160]|uniref:prolyl oligopeptidase family serine peptidase n=1 Tax=Sphingomonas sp. LY160 TaxID=3095342 RepID=UPI002ADED2EB|nr:prolyl oligopeptidase family serine peptidase [Sphingomonas sp. LY160]MEA1071946.1 prolyl oligopeptidase family serine peptidase [Sphingomonas sp. LY160]
MRIALSLTAVLLSSACATVPAPPPPPELAAAEAAAAEPVQESRITYPTTRRTDLVEPQFGVNVADPYRWLENDVRNDPEVRQWVTGQNEITNQYLASLPLRDAFKARMTELYDFERFGVPRKEGGRYFYSRNNGLQNQSVLYVRDTVNGEGRVLIDPNGWSADGATALAEWTPSDDGKLLAYAVQDGGTDWRSVKVLDVTTGQLRTDELKWLKFGGGVDWAKDGSGFYYSRFPEPEASQTFQATSLNQRVYFHKLGTPQSADRLVYATPEHPEYGHGATISEDGKWLVVTTSVGTDDRYEVTLIDLTKPNAKPRTLVKGFTNNYSYAGNQGNRFYFVTNDGAPKLKLVAMDVGQANPKPVTLIPEDQATLDGVSLVGGRIVASYLVDAKTEVRTYGMDGQLIRKVALPGIGTASGFGGDMKDRETFFAFTSFNRPTTIYRYDVDSGQASEWAAPKVAFNPDDYTVEQRFYASKDGTRVPMFIVRKAGTSGPAPTLLYGYGGFNVSLTPSFSPTRLAWLEKGGVFALANLRGGGEYGKAWHDAGRLANKQNVFDDFIAAGEYLKAQGIAGSNQLAISGGSNGGLLVGAVVNQRPDLFAAASPAVGVMDMLRFDKFTAGRYWVDDYGYPNKEADFKAQYAYSPYHNIKGGRDYPAILVTTADTDDRVVPGHSFKYISALQAAEATGNKPHLIRIETRAGHGSGKPTTKIIEESADVYAFLAKWTGME